MWFKLTLIVLSLITKKLIGIELRRAITLIKLSFLGLRLVVIRDKLKGDGRGKAYN
jgi:hypothetical protein